MAKPDSKQASRGQVDGKQAGHRQPITRHPLFPAVVALWFAALLSMGSFALSTSLLENLIVAARLDSVVPAAAPPLGMTARLLLALALGLIGGALGWALAKHVSAPQTVTAPHVFNVAEADLGAPSQWPGVAEAPIHREPSAAKPVPMPAPASLAGQVEGAEAPLPAIALAPVQEMIGQGVTVQDTILPEPIVQQVIPAEPPAPSAHSAAQRIAGADLAELSHVELVERLAIALQQREEMLGGVPDTAAIAGASVLAFPDFADRRNTRMMPPAAQSRPAPQETEKALRAALAQLERISGYA